LKQLNDGPALLHPRLELEAEIIALFVDLMRCFGAPKSLGAIYGMLFVSETPVSFEQIVARLQLSSGSVSQGLRLLKGLGAATVVFVPGDRRDHYVAETRLRRLAAGLLRQRADAEFTNASERLGRVVDQFRPDAPSSAPTSAFLGGRVAILERWQKQARNLLPVLLEVLGN
jgi:DNA-binding transcriptional regulator GbsR (MarR family)